MKLNRRTDWAKPTEHTLQSWFVDSTYPRLQNRIWRSLCHSHNLKYVVMIMKYVTGNVTHCLTFYSSFSCVILIDYTSHLPAVRSWMCVLWTEQTAVIQSLCFYLLINEYGRNIVWEKQFLRRHNNSCPHFSHPLRNWREELDCCTERHSQWPTTDFCVGLTFSFSQIMMAVCRNVSHVTIV